MKRDNFEKLSMAEQGMTLISEGKHITQIKKDNYLINLYSIEDFFVEVYYSVIDNHIDKIEIMNDLSKIDLYIDEKRPADSIETN